MPLRSVQKFSVHPDVIAFVIGLGAKFGDDLSVYRYQSAGNQFLSFAARSDSGSGNNFL